MVGTRARAGFWEKEAFGKRLAMVSGVVGFAVVGTALLLISHAATSNANFEVEAGMVNSPQPPLPTVVRLAATR